MSWPRTTIRDGRWRSRVVALAACLICGAASATASTDGPPPRSEEALWSRLRRIETAFRDGNAGALRASLASDGKLRLDLPQVPGGPASYGPGQVQAIFAALFRRQRTGAFEFPKDDVARPSESMIFARARWRRGSGDPSPQTLTFTLRAENGDWRVHEIVAAQ